MSGTSTRDAAGFGDTLLAAFFREYRELESQRVLSRNDVSAEVRATWCHDMDRSYVDLIVIREDARGNPRQSAGWSISYTSAIGVRDLD